MGMAGVLFLGLLCRVLPSNHGIPVEGTHQNQPYRTAYHFQPPKNWLNDPNGPMWHKGVYHLFHQYNPNGALFGDGLVWAHSVSYDLINWIHLSHALSPTEPFDMTSCWSGSVTLLPGDTPVIMYTGIDANRSQVQNLAAPANLSDPLLQHWVKSPRNPVMTPPNGVEVDKFRDPTTAWLGPDAKWRVIIGGWSNNQGMAILYRSDDFVNWTKHQHPLYSNERTGMWECPDFFPVSVNSTNGIDTSVMDPGVKHVLKASFNLHDYYMIGAYDPEMEKYVPDKDFTGTYMDLRYDYGKFYASKTFFDGFKKRRILWGWVNESDSMEDDIKKGWSGLQSIPREIWLDGSGKQLVQRPVEEINQLHGKQVSMLRQNLESNSVFEIQGITASQADVEIEFELQGIEEAEIINSTSTDPQLLCDELKASVNGKFGPFGLLALATEDLTERTAIFFRVLKGLNGSLVLMCSDQSRSSLKNDIDKTTYGAFLEIDPQQEKISLRSLIDHSIVESFGGEGRSCITSRVYPTLAVHENAHLYLFNYGTMNVMISSLNAWSMNNAHFSHEGSLNWPEDSEFHSLFYSGKNKPSGCLEFQ